jgi:hypothetical protein
MLGQQSVANELAAAELRGLTTKCRRVATCSSDTELAAELRQMAREFAAMAARATS